MNHLIHETSPYLLQHAGNPVDWYAWKPEALEKAKKEDKPILVSIGYSTCHWCHVMEHESFEDPRIAAYMNEHFVNIKVDREERPDLDQIYMEAVQALSGQGGWPLNCFLTPDGRPYFGGTYFPPEPAHNRPSWLQVLQSMVNAFQNKRNVVEDQADKLTELIRNSDHHYINNTFEGLDPVTVFTPAMIQNCFQRIKGQFDPEFGGFGGAPKFPGTMTLQWLLEYHYHTDNPEALGHVQLSLDRMCMGGIYDQLGGGFARYATDRAWLVPHFEKMLYDNALLVNVLSDAYKCTQKPLYKKTIQDTLAFVVRELSSPEGGFYAALDADSEGEEGVYYVWSQQEVNEVLGDKAALFSAYYDITKEGNWEHRNILWRQFTTDAFASSKGLQVGELEELLETCRRQLFERRETRIRPGLDDKILLGWNALMCSAFANAFGALQEESYRSIAIRNMDFLLEKFDNGGEGALFHSYKDGKVQYAAFLDDYAFLTEALLDVYRISSQTAYLEKARQSTDFIINHFMDKTDNLFYFTSESQQDIILRKKELYDSAIPSGNSTMVRNLMRLGILLDRRDWITLAEKMLMSTREVLERYPASFSRWAGSMLKMVYPGVEIAIVGNNYLTYSDLINQWYLPGSLLMATPKEDNQYPLLAGKNAGEETLFYICHNYACKAPVKTLEEVSELIRNAEKK